MSHVRGLRIAAAGTVVAGALLGCGSEGEPTDDADVAGATTTADTTAIDGLSGREIVAKAREALTSMSSIRVQFDIATADGDVVVDLAADRDGTCAGTAGIDGQGSFEIIKIDDNVWMKLDKAFWESQLPPAEAEVASEILGDRYLTGPSDHEMLGPISEICIIDQLLEEPSDLIDPDSEFTKGELTTLDGRKVVAVHWTTEEGDFTLYVDAGGDFYPVKLVNEGGDEPGTMSFSAFDEPVTPTPPAEEDTLDVSAIESAVQGD